MKFLQIISGGQTGVDRAALDFALQNGVDCDGWCPQGRISEDGPIDIKYPLNETKSSNPEERTKRNVSDSDGVLILVDDKMDLGTVLTIDFAEISGKPLYLVHLRMNRADQEEGISSFIEEYKLEKINIAGPRESNSPGIYDKATAFLNELFWKYKKRPPQFYNQ